MFKKLLSLAAFVMCASSSFAKEDVTSTYLTNADLTSLEGWTIYKDADNAIGGNNGYTAWKTDSATPVIEFYHSWSSKPGTAIGNTKSFDFAQTVTLPAGYYRLKVNAFYREGNGGSTSQEKTFIYATTKTDGTYDYQKYIGTWSSLSGYSGSSELYMAADAFSKGAFANEFDFDVTEDNTSVTIGFHGYIDTYCSWCILGPVTLYKYEIGDFTKDFNDKADEAKALYNTPMDKDVLATLKAKAEVDQTGWTTKNEISDASSELNTAINNANASIKVYADAKTRRDQYAARAAAAGVTVSTDAFDAAYTAGTLDNELADVKSALDTEVGKIVSAYADKTDKITNPSFENENPKEGWTLTDFGDAATNTNFAKVGNAFVEKWTAGPGKLTDGSLTQKVTLPAGIYLLTAKAQLHQQGNANVIPGGMFIKAGDKKVEVTNLTETYVVAFNVAADGTEVEIGATFENCTGNWGSVDNFQLKQLALVEGNMNADVATAQTNAQNAYAADPTAEKYNALLEAMAAANASVDEYKAIDAAMKSTASAAANFSEEAKNVYDDTDVKNKYDNGTYNTAAEAKKGLNKALATAVTNTCAIGDDITLLVSNAECNNGKSAGVWTPTPDATTDWYIEDGSHTIIDFGNTMHVNTWSTEGNTDGSNMKTAFTQIWGYTPDKDIHVMHDQLTGLRPGNYTVTIQARVRDFINGATTPDGLNWMANEERAVMDWTEGVACSYATLSVTCEVKLDGTLDFGFKYSKDYCNFTWLSFKNVTLTYNGLQHTRQTGKGLYGTVCLPYAFTATNATIYSASLSEDNTSVILTAVEEPEAGVPYIYQALEEGCAQIFTYSSGSLVSEPVEALPLVGVFEVTSVPDGSYVLQTNWTSNDGGEQYQKFYKVIEGYNPEAPAYRAYLNVPSSGEGDAKSLSIGIAEETAIKALDGLTSGDAKIYDLNGRELKSLQKGINLVNGVKVMVK